MESIVMYKVKFLTCKKVKIKDGFLRNLQNLVKRTVLPFQWNILCDEINDAKPSHCIENFRIAAGEKMGEFSGCTFQDSDVAKWLEAVAYALMSEPNDELEKLADEVIDLIGKAQQPDGYLNTFYIIKGLDKRFTNLREDHELYSAGHMMEASIAYYEATGKRKLLDIMMKMAKCIDREIGPEPGKKHGYPGHPEIELALMRLYQVTGEDFLYRLAKYFINTRGTKPCYFDWEQKTYCTHKTYKIAKMNEATYAQYHIPVREQETIEGHCVRALYLLAGMIDIAAESGDIKLLEACHALYDNATNKRMYVTGGLGSTVQGEAFTLDYDLPNDTIYAETCASIALIFVSHRMFCLKPESCYADIIERAFYNCCLASMGIEGKSFFYVNPLEVDPAKSAFNPDKSHVMPVRSKWFDCACCPPNISRLILSFGQYIIGVYKDNVYINQFISCDAEIEVLGRTVKISIETSYPISGKVTISTSDGNYSLNLRIPDWAINAEIIINGVYTEFKTESGYAVINRKWSKCDCIELILDMSVRRIYSNPSVSENMGKVALQRGPLVYCMEEIDNGDELHRISILRNSEIKEEFKPNLLNGVMCLKVNGMKIQDNWEELYRYDCCESYKLCEVTLIPYYLWANRNSGEMQVWIRELQ
jgi:DUF1680 family protein